MPKGSKCSFCGELTLHVDSSESFRECSTCGFAGWKVGDPVYPGKRKGFKCVNCQKQTLHPLTMVADTGVQMFRCSVCFFAGVKPPPK